MHVHVVVYPGGGVPGVMGWWVHVVGYWVHRGRGPGCVTTVVTTVLNLPDSVTTVVTTVLNLPDSVNHGGTVFITVLKC